MKTLTDEEDQHRGKGAPCGNAACSLQMKQACLSCCGEVTLKEIYLTLDEGSICLAVLEEHCILPLERTLSHFTFKHLLPQVCKGKP